MRFADSALLKLLGILLLTAAVLKGWQLLTETLQKGTWLVLLYHYDCPDCGWAIPKYEQMARFFVSTNYLTHSPNRKEVKIMIIELLDDR